MPEPTVRRLDDALSQAGRERNDGGEDDGSDGGDFHKQKAVAHVGSDLGASTVECCDAGHANNSDDLHDTRGCGAVGQNGAAKVLGEDGGDDGDGRRLGHHDPGPGEQEAHEIAIGRAQILLDAAVLRDAQAELDEGSSAGPDEQAADDPDCDTEAGRGDMLADLGWRGEDAGPDLQADHDGEAVEKGQSALWWFCRVAVAPGRDRRRGPVGDERDGLAQAVFKPKVAVGADGRSRGRLIGVLVRLACLGSVFRRVLFKTGGT